MQLKLIVAAQVCPPRHGLITIAIWKRLKRQRLLVLFWLCDSNIVIPIESLDTVHSNTVWSLVD